MEQLPRLKARISSLHELRDLIRALRMLAAVHVKEAQAALQGIRGFVGVMEDAIAEGATLLGDADGRDAAVGSPGASVLIVVCSEQGFVGALNLQGQGDTWAVAAADGRPVCIGNAKMSRTH